MKSVTCAAEANKLYLGDLLNHHLFERILLTIYKINTQYIKIAHFLKWLYIYTHWPERLWQFRLTMLLLQYWCSLFATLLTLNQSMTCGLGNTSINFDTIGICQSKVQGWARKTAKAHVTKTLLCRNSWFVALLNMDTYSYSKHRRSVCFCNSLLHCGNFDSWV